MPDTINHPLSADAEVAQALQASIRALARAEQAPPLEIQLETSHAEKQIVLARNWLIDRLRKDPGAPEGRSWQDLLVRLNQVLSLVVGVEYPSSFARREMIGQAKDFLEGLLGENLL
jgi:hypothetical protein